MDKYLNDLLQLLSEEELIRIRWRADRVGNESLVKLLTEKILERTKTEFTEES